MNDKRLQFTLGGSKPNAAPLRSLFVALTQAALASSVSVGCETDGGETSHENEGGRRSDRDSSTVHRDAGLLDSGGDREQDASRDAMLDTGLAPGFERIACTSSVAELGPQLKTPANLDYVGVYGGSVASIDGRTLPDGGAPQAWTREVARSGKACSGVADAAACEAELSSLRATPPCAQAPCEPFLIAQQAGALSRLDARPDVLALFGGIDTKAEAALLAAFSGQRLCDDLGDRPGSSIAATATGYEIRALYDVCSDWKYRDRLTVDADGTLTVLEHVKEAPSSCAIGRRPDGLCTPASSNPTSRRGRYLADAAHLEAASVYAFEKLARELLALSAPRALLDAVHAAKNDEIRHALAVAGLARTSGGRLKVPVVQETPLRSRLELALDNASEGCVRETFGALLATYQAENATDARIRAVMIRVAEDETRHAALSWALQTWLEAGLSESERAQVASTQTRALDQLARELDPDLSDADLRALGLPDHALSSVLLAGLRTALPWTEAAQGAAC